MHDPQAIMFRAVQYRFWQDHSSQLSHKTPENTRVMKHPCKVSTWLRACELHRLIFPVAQQPHSGLGCLMVEVSGSHTHTHTHTLGRKILDEGSARHRDLYLTTNNIYKREKSMPWARFEPAAPASERTQSYALDCAATEIGTPPAVAFNNSAFNPPHPP